MEQYVNENGLAQPMTGKANLITSHKRTWCAAIFAYENEVTVK
jgi:hypothetical protein